MEAGRGQEEVAASGKLVTAMQSSIGGLERSGKEYPIDFGCFTDIYYYSLMKAKEINFYIYQGQRYRKLQ